jgi:hypothetical protein
MKIAPEAVPFVRQASKLELMMDFDKNDPFMCCSYSCYRGVFEAGALCTRLYVCSSFHIPPPTCDCVTLENTRGRLRRTFNQRLKNDWLHSRLQLATLVLPLYVCWCGCGAISVGASRVFVF